MTRAEEQARPFARQTSNQGINNMLALRRELIDPENRLIVTRWAIKVFGRSRKTGRYDAIE